MREPLFWAAVASCIVAQALIFRSTWRAGVRTASGDERPDVPRSPASAELVWVILPALMLAVVLAFTWRAIRESAPSRGAAPVPHQHDAPPLLL